MNSLLLLSKAYTEPGRFYHNLYHISSMMHLAEAMEIDLFNYQIMAIWWHDAVYNPLSDNSEEDSVLWMREVEADTDTSDLDKAGNIILCTKDHAPIFEYAKVVLDLDMAILSAAPAVYGEYAKGVSDEYEAAGISREVYAKGRVKFLVDALGKAEDNGVYYTKLFKPRNKQAMTNLSWELAFWEVKNDGT